MGRIFSLLRRYYPLLVVLGAYVGALVAVGLNRAEQPGEGQIVIRLGHWQLETGVREAFDRMAADYEALHPGVRIIPQAIPESTYKQWLSTQVIGGTAPDLVEIGRGVVPANLVLAFQTRYLLPLTAFASQPNPYNAGTEFEGVPLRLTMKDAMRSAYVETLQEYMGVPLAQFSMRLCYNRDLLEKLTGRSEPPSDYREFLALCREIQQRMDETGRSYIPIASSKYHFPMWEARVFDPITFPALWEADFGRDGTLGKDELFLAMKGGLLDFHFPPFAARFGMVRDLTPLFQTGFTGLTRDEAVFLFAQQQAVFLPAGTWDVLSLVEQARGKFEIGIMDFPVPGPDDPVYGKVVAGPYYEESMSGFAFSVARTSRHPEVALDFLMFMASRERNEELNRIIGWIPVVRGAAMSPLLRKFEPRLEGIYKAFDVSLGGDTIVKWEQLDSLYQVGQIDYEQMAADYQAFYTGPKGLRDFLEIKRDSKRGRIRNEQLVTGLRARALLADSATAEGGWLKYRTMTAGRIVKPDLGQNRQMQMLAQAEAGEKLTGAYAYRPLARENLERRIAAELAKGEAKPAP